MSRWTATLIALTAAPCGATVAAASEPPAAIDTGRNAEVVEAPDVPPTIVRREVGRLHMSRPVLGNGYVAYRYPAFDTCPCDDAGCYHPGWYYCGGKSYRQAWWRRWVGAHLGGGSMLDGYPCHCVLPTVGRPYGMPAVDGAPDASERRAAEPEAATAAP